MNPAQLINDGALVVSNNSGGKDSQAMLAILRQMVPDKKNLLVIHANLSGAEWSGTEQHAKDFSSGLEFITVKSKKTFEDMVRHRGMFPSPKYRQCTSDLKRAPIQKAIRHHCKDHGYNLVLNCMGIRAEESPGRKKMQAFKLNKSMSNKKRTVYDWFPIFDYTTRQVFDTIENAGQKPHEVYAQGISRLSCAICIMSSKADLQKVAKIWPEQFEKYARLEREIGHTVMMPRKGHPALGLYDYIK